ncbi:hypothetical protein [Pseudomonas helleri]
MHDTRRIVRCALFEQLPYSQHMESRGLLERK